MVTSAGLNVTRLRCIHKRVMQMLLRMCYWRFSIQPPRLSDHRQALPVPPWISWRGSACTMTTFAFSDCRSVFNELLNIFSVLCIFHPNGRLSMQPAMSRYMNKQCHRPTCLYQKERQWVSTAGSLSFTLPWAYLRSQRFLGNIAHLLLAYRL